MRQFAAAIAIVGLILLAESRSPLATSTPFVHDPSISRLLDRYEDGDYASAREVAEGVKDFGTFARAFISAAPSWVSAAGPALADKRRLRAATFVLEVAWAVSEAWKPIEDWVRDWPPLRGLIEWACALMRSATEPTEPERLWHRASHELGMRRDSIFLFGEGNVPRDRKAATDREYGSAQNHVAHGVDRFPDDREFQFLQTELGSSPQLHLIFQAANWVTRGTSVTPAEFKELQAEARAVRVRRRLPNAPRHRSDADVLRRSDFLTELEALRPRIEALLEVQEVRARVHFDLGLIAYCFGDRSNALRSFSEIDDNTSDINLRFLGRFLLGFVNGQYGNEAASEAAYRAAHALLPSAQSATIALAEILYTTGRRVEATKLADEGIESASGMRRSGMPADPWHQFITFGRVQPADGLVSLRHAVAK